MSALREYRELGAFDEAGAEAALYAEIHADLRRCIFHKVAPSDIDDVLQEIWLAIRESVFSFKGKTENSFKSWYRVIARRKAADSHRKRLEIFPVEEITDMLDKLQQVHYVSEADRIDCKQAMDALAKLKPDCVDLLYTRFGLQFRYTEMAESMELDADTVRMRVSRCLEAVRGLI